MKKHLLSILSILLIGLGSAWAADPTIGQLVCPTGAPLANCPVHVEYRSSTSLIASADTTTDAAGRFSVTLNCSNSTAIVGGHFLITSRCCGHPWVIPSPRCSGDLGTLVCQECRPNPCIPPPPGMVDWWTFDELLSPAIMVANDIAGAVNNKGFHVNGPTPIAAGKVNGALCFDGQDDWVQVRDHNEVDFLGLCLPGALAEDFSIDAWVRTEVTDGYMTVLDKRVDPQNPVGYTLFIVNGRLGFQMADGAPANYVEPGASITPGKWHLIAVTVDRCANGVGILYVDGNPVFVFNPVRGNIANDSDLYIGRPSPGFGATLFRGCLDELEFFKRALKPDEVKALFDADSAGKCRPCIVLRCPEDIREWTCGDGKDVNYVVDFANLCNSNVTLRCEPPSGSFFPVGSHTVVCQVRDVAGLVLDECSFRVTVVRDTTPPEIRCPSNQVYWVCSPNGGVINYTVDATDDCDTNVTVICQPPSGTFLPPGDHTVVCRAFDDCQNMSSCEFKVTINVDREPPRIFCPEDIRRWVCESNAVAVNYTVTATDDSGFVTVVCNPPSGSLFPIGTTTVQCRAIDRCERESRCEFTVSILLDDEPPRLICPDTIRAITCESNGVAVNYNVIVTDNADPTPTLVCNPPSGSVFPVGSTVVRCIAVDNCRNTNICTFKVEVVLDSEPPRITCPDDIRRVICTSNAVINYIVSASDDTDPTPTVVCVPPSGSVFPPGITVVHCQATDDCGKVSRCEFKVELVRDTEPPRLICPDDIRRVICESNAVINYTVTVTDDTDPNPTLVCMPPSGSVFPIGTTVVVCRAWDNCQNESRCEFKVTLVRDTEPPRIICPDDIRVWTCATNGTNVSYTVTATDDHDPNPTIVCVPPSGSMFPIGITTVTCRAVDKCGNESRCEFKVGVIRDLEPPRIFCPSNMNVVATCTNRAKVNYTVTATDDCDTNVTITCVPPSGSVFPAGVTTVNCVAVDDCGNRSQCSFLVRVREAARPTLTIRRLGHGMIAVCWPLSSHGFQLQSADHINPPGPPFAWVDVPDAPIIMDGQYCVIFDTAGRHRFYRMRCSEDAVIDTAATP